MDVLVRFYRTELPQSADISHMARRGLSAFSRLGEYFFWEAVLFFTHQLDIIKALPVSTRPSPPRRWSAGTRACGTSGINTAHNLFELTGDLPGITEVTERVSAVVRDGGGRGAAWRRRDWDYIAFVFGDPQISMMNATIHDPLWAYIDRRGM